jgi:hypothetical protein
MMENFRDKIERHTDSPHPSLDDYLKELIQHYEIGTILHHLGDLMIQGVNCHCGCDHGK